MKKTKLVVLDALMGIYEGSAHVPPQGIDCKIIMSKDRVATDVTGLGVINARRKERGLEPITREKAGHIWSAEKLTFGGAYAVLGYISQQAVSHYHWIMPEQMMDGLGLAETTPGPLILVLEFLGFVAAYREPGSLPPALAGTLGAAVTVWATFAPSFLWIFLGAPWIEHLRANRPLRGALAAVTPAVVGVIASLALTVAAVVLFDEVRTASPFRASIPVPVWTSLNVFHAFVAFVAFVASRWFRVSVVWIVGLSAAAGLLWAALR